jgi:hypothetical protein
MNEPEWANFKGEILNLLGEAQGIAHHLGQVKDLVSSCVAGLRRAGAPQGEPSAMQPTLTPPEASFPFSPFSSKNIRGRFGS